MLLGIKADERDGVGRLIVDGKVRAQDDGTGERKTVKEATQTESG